VWYIYLYKKAVKNELFAKHWNVSIFRFIKTIRHENSLSWPWHQLSWLPDYPLQKLHAHMASPPTRIACPESGSPRWLASTKSPSYSPQSLRIPSRVSSCDICPIHCLLSISSRRWFLSSSWQVLRSDPDVPLLWRGMLLCGAVSVDN